MKSINTKWIIQNIDQINLIDVRTPGEFAQKHIEGSKNIPYPGIIFNAENLLNKNKKYYLICHSGNRSGTAVKNLKEQGFDVEMIVGGISAL